MTKKQHKEIALMWSASIVYMAGMDSFDSDIDLDDSGEIVEQAQQLAMRILRKRPLLNTLPEIIDWVLNK